MKGQYFSFDAIVAAIIMVIAFTSLVAYWYGVQSVIETRTDTLYADAIRVADTLMTPGTPNWQLLVGGIPQRQIGLTNNFTNELNVSNIGIFATIVGCDTGCTDFKEGNYTAVGNIFRVNEYFIVIEYVNGTTFSMIGKNYTNAEEVAVAHRAGTLDVNKKPVRMKVYVWR